MLRIIIEISMRCSNCIGSHKRGLCTAGNRDLLMSIKGTDRRNNEPRWLLYSVLVWLFTPINVNLPSLFNHTTFRLISKYYFQHNCYTEYMVIVPRSTR